VSGARGEQVDLQELVELAQALPFHLDRFCGRLVHELAHAIDSLADGEFQCWADAIDIRERRVASAGQQFDRLVEYKQSEHVAPSPQLHCHGLRFTRIMAHLDYRLRGAGVRANWDVAGARFNQRPFDDCVAALGDEPARCVNKSFKEILQLPMPSAFAACELMPAVGAA
jgi:hypothetical protein